MDYFYFFGLRLEKVPQVPKFITTEKTALVEGHK